jgi:sigma-B regulation protein RsbU (phosphoserine phosphatase)
MIPKKAPCIQGLDVAAVYQPCYQIGGDLYDFLQVGEKRLVVGIADVIGKGIPAAIMMSMFRGTLRAYTDGGYSRHSMEEVIHRLNRSASIECRDGEFITLFIAQVDIETNTLTYCSCGHEPGSNWTKAVWCLAFFPMRNMSSKRLNSSRAICC